MSDDHSLAPGANAPLAGTRVQLTLAVPQLGGATLAVESEAGEVRLLGPADSFAQLQDHDERTKVVQLDLAAVPAEVARLRLLVWSPGPTLALARAQVAGRVDGAAAFDVVLPEQARELRAAELLEIYRRADAWKVRAVASGWMDHLGGMASAVGVPVSAFPVASPPPPEPAASEPERYAELPPHEGPSPPVGPPALRDLLDMIVGPGPRVGDDSFVDFALDGVFMRLTYESGGDFARVIATTPAGEGRLDDTVALASLRATGEAPLGRVSFDDDGAAFVSAPAVAERRNVDTALVKALLAEVWVTATRFAARVRTTRWRFPDAPGEQLPRELRLGVGEELQDPAAWSIVRDRLLEAACLPLVDEPAAMLALTDRGQLVVGPCLLAGTPRGWTILVERTVRANVRPGPGLWSGLARYNRADGFVRFAVQPEGLPGDPPAIVVGYSALQLSRTAVLEDLGRGLDLVDEAVSAVDPLLRELAADSADHRNNLPWPQGRRWTGPGSEIRDHLLVREIAGLAAGADVPAQLIKRVRAQRATLGRAGCGYLAHLALLRAEARDRVSAEWQSVARELLVLAPVQPQEGDEPSATASVHVRLGRLDAPRPMRPPPPPTGPAPARRGRDLFR